MRAFLDDFKKFIMRGNVLDLAVAIVIGVAFTALIQSFVNNILLQIIAAIGGKPDFSQLQITIHKAHIRWGAFITDLIGFVIIAFAVFIAVKAFEAMQKVRRRGDVAEDPQELSDEAVLLTEIRDLLRAQTP